MGLNCPTCGAPVRFSDWDEDKHPRDDHGRWSAGGGGGHDTEHGSTHTAAIARPSSDYKPVNPSGHDTREKYFDGAAYTHERQQLHAAIEAKHLGDTTPVDNPTAIMLGGGPASGKSFLVEKMGLGGDNFVHVNPDEIKKDIPEYREGLKAGNKSAAALAHEESSDVSKHLMYTAAATSRNILLDGTGDNSIENLRNKVATMRAGGQRVEGHYVTCGVKQAIDRADARGAKTGRYVPHEYITSVHQSVARVLPEAIRQGLFDKVSLWDSSGNGQKLVATAVKDKLTVHDHDAWKRFTDRGKTAD